MERIPFQRRTKERQSSPLLLWLLSTTWFLLCVSLVVKYTALMTVFGAFLSCFVLSVVFQLYYYYYYYYWTERRQTHTKKVQAQSKIPTTTTTTTHMISIARNVEGWVGVWICSISFVYLGVGPHVRDVWSTKQHITNTMTPAWEADFGALSLAAGYLAFSHWYSSWHSLCKPFLSVAEDALTLTLALVYLVHKHHEPIPTMANNHGGATSPITAPTVIGIWLCYKLLRLGKQLQSSNRSRIKQTVVPLLQPIPQRPFTTKNDIQSTPVKSVDNQTTNVTTMPSTWIIHGQQYNLTTFVDRHPGGREAILLGQGRDCTALFESYHPFTNKHVKTLEKYTTQANCPTPPQDVFYTELCRRVEAQLQAVGVDPVENRAATPLRTMYYWTIAAALTMSGVAHCKVRR